MYTLNFCNKAKLFVRLFDNTVWFIPYLVKMTLGSSGSGSPPPELCSNRNYTDAQQAAVARALSPLSYYELLGVEVNCSADELKKAYRKHALLVHPDKNAAPKSPEAFRRVGQAYQCLNNPSKRAMYNQFGADADAGSDDPFKATYEAQMLSKYDSINHIPLALY